MAATRISTHHLALIAILWTPKYLSGQGSPSLSPSGATPGTAVAAVIQKGTIAGLRRPALGTLATDLRTLYAATPDGFGWVQAGRPTTQAVAVIATLVHADTRGLDLLDYDAPWLADHANRMAQAATAGTPWPADSLATFDVALSLDAMRYASDVHVGRVNPRNVKFDLVVDRAHLDRVATIQRIQASQDPGAALAALEPPFVHYRILLDALARTRADTADPQRATHVRQIILTLERWRWLPTDLGQRFVLVNVPAFQLYGFDVSISRDTPQVTMPVVVGRAARTPTPIFSGQMRYLFFRPYWNVPPGILRKETLPKLRRDPGYLKRAQLEIVDANAPDAPAKTYPPTAANLARLASGKLRVRQTPGPKNSLGLVKFLFPNQYDVYLHDTPEQDLFEHERRDFSHGCIRVANPPALVQFVLADQAMWTPAAIDSAMHRGRDSRQVFLTNPLPVYVLYGTVLAQPDGTIHFYDDVYHLDATLERALAARR